MSKLFVGIDVSSRKNVIHFMLPDGSKHSSFSVDNNFNGARLLVRMIISALVELQLQNVVIGLEATSVYGDNLIFFLRESSDLAKFQPDLHILNPKQVKKFKDAYPDLPKNDPVDAFIIADALRFGRITNKLHTDDYRYQALKTLTRARFFAVQNLTKEKQRFMNYLFMKFSSFTQDKVFSDSFGASALSLYTEFDSVEELAAMNLTELTDFIRKTGRNRFPDPDAVAKAIQAAVRSSYRLPKTLVDSVNQVLALSIIYMRSLKEQIKSFDKAIELQLQSIPNTLTSVKGIGLVFSAGIIAEVGDIKRFSNQAALAKYAGLVWTQHQSGNYEAQNTRLINSGNRFLKYYLTEAAYSLLRCDAEFKRYYSLKKSEVNRGQVKRALALTARKLVRLVFALLKDNKLYIAPEV
ncbi:IS110 family transposase [uncultured Phascolarctobacterium sp.]|uniref:IS110 family transposase n=1 Tax=uncultured Phascolarctobacterium sp. TaxID=512296 RepID=UPI0027D97FA2|nr:IS110 family transposase [uncultured Phascolarctobacterium sp.]